jgi:hypothetical protein
MRHCLQTLIGDSAVLSAKSRAHLSRKLTSRTVVTTSYQRSLEKRNEEFHNNGQAGKGTSRDRWVKERGVRPANSVAEKPPTDVTRALYLQLRHLKDPVKLADCIRQKLREDDFDTAQNLVRAASKDTQCTVSWNYLVDYQLSKGQMNSAIKTYNEVLSILHSSKLD